MFLKGDVVVSFVTLLKSEVFEDYEKLNLEKESAYLSCLAVKENYRGKGIGRESINLILDNCFDLNFNNLYVRTRKKHQSLII